MKKVIGSILFVCIIIVPFRVNAGSARGLVDSGNAFYAAGEYDKALESYDKALSERPDSGEILFNKGNAFFKKGEYEKAREAYQASALKRKDLSLDASAYFNLGNTVFAEGQKQLESDPQKALSQWGQSIHHYQEALRIDPELKEAAQNIEVVRVTMKEVADRIKKAEELAKERQKQSEEIQKELDEVIKEQESELRENETLQQKSAQPPGDSLEKEARELASDQEKTREKTGKVGDKLKALEAGRQQESQSQQQPESREEIVPEHLEKAREAQRSAAQKLERNDLKEALKDQEEALKRLKEVQKKTESSKGDKGQCPNPKADDHGGEETPVDKDQDQSASRDQPDEKKEDGAKPAEQQQSAENESQSGKDDHRAGGDEKKTCTVLSESPDNILREEKENRLERHRAAQGGYKPVEKDW
ncbi:MAG: tetratricopeptide repeat protein [Syntrophobacteraceae bacterium]